MRIVFPLKPLVLQLGGQHYPPIIATTTLASLLFCLFSSFRILAAHLPRWFTDRTLALNGISCHTDCFVCTPLCDHQSRFRSQNNSRLSRYIVSIVCVSSWTATDADPPQTDCMQQLFCMYVHSPKSMLVKIPGNIIGREFVCTACPSMSVGCNCGGRIGMTSDRHWRRAPYLSAVLIIMDAYSRLWCCVLFSFVLTAYIFCARSRSPRLPPKQSISCTKECVVHTQAHS